ncbi:hypothetical protein ANTRET_LOCUS4877 [Anthophora retusa]
MGNEGGRDGGRGTGNGDGDGDVAENGNEDDDGDEDGNLGAGRGRSVKERRRGEKRRRDWRGMVARGGFLRVESKPITYYNCRRRGRRLTEVGVAVRHPSSRLMAPLSCQ